MCALGASVQKYTTFLCTPGLQPSLASLATLTCVHKTHEQQVGGHLEADRWSSSSHAAYPPDLNLLIAKAINVRSVSVPPATIRPSSLSQPIPPTANDSGPPTTHPFSDMNQTPDAPPAPPDAAHTSEHRLSLPNRDFFRRGLGAYPLRSKEPAGLFTSRISRRTPLWGRSSGCAFAGSFASAGPKTRKQALKLDHA
eukprot:1008110-Pleurochrysis_carterae.AAC.1